MSSKDSDLRALSLCFIKRLYWSSDMSLRLKKLYIKFFLIECWKRHCVYSIRDWTLTLCTLFFTVINFKSIILTLKCHQLSADVRSYSNWPSKSFCSYDTIRESLSSRTIERLSFNRTHRTITIKLWLDFFSLLLVCRHWLFSSRLIILIKYDKEKKRNHQNSFQQLLTYWAN